jgi:hypothetical protein
MWLLACVILHLVAISRQVDVEESHRKPSSFLLPCELHPAIAAVGG